MEKIKKWKVNLKNELLSEESTGILANSMDIARCTDGINEIVDWINLAENLFGEITRWAKLKEKEKHKKGSENNDGS